MSDSLGIADELEELEDSFVEYDAEALNGESADLIDLDELEEIDFDALGLDPLHPTEAKPGSNEKVLMLAARYAAGLPLWHNSDCYDHGPGAALIEEV